MVCFDETSTQLLADTRPPAPAQPGRPARQDYEYRREGTRNLFLACEPKAGWRQVTVTERRNQARLRPPVRLAGGRSLSGGRQPEHSPHGVAVRDLQRPKPGGLPNGWSFTTPRWLNMAEIEFSVLSRCCLKRRIPDEETLEREVQALVRERNASQAVINWRFNTQDARSKLHRLYPFDS